MLSARASTEEDKRALKSEHDENRARAKAMLQTRLGYDKLPCSQVAVPDDVARSAAFSAR